MSRSPILHLAWFFRRLCCVYPCMVVMVDPNRHNNTNRHEDDITDDSLSDSDGVDEILSKVGTDQEAEFLVRYRNSPTTCWERATDMVAFDPSVVVLINDYHKRMARRSKILHYRSTIMRHYALKRERLLGQSSDEEGDFDMPQSRRKRRSTRLLLSIDDDEVTVDVPEVNTSEPSIDSDTTDRSRSSILRQMLNGSEGVLTPSESPVQSGNSSVIDCESSTARSRVIYVDELAAKHTTYLRTYGSREKDRFFTVASYNEWINANPEMRRLSKFGERLFGSRIVCIIGQCLTRLEYYLVSLKPRLNKPTPTKVDSTSMFLCAIHRDVLHEYAPKALREYELQLNLV